MVRTAGLSPSDVEKVLSNSKDVSTASSSSQSIDTRTPNLVNPVLFNQAIPVAFKVNVFHPAVGVILVAPSVGLLTAPQSLKSNVNKVVSKA